MAKQTINVGITANDRRGDPLRVAFTKINENFDEVYDIIPTQLSDLANDEGFITANSLPTQLSDLTNDTGYITANSLPTQLSDLTNDEGFITNETTHMTLTQRYQFGEPVFFSNQSDVSLTDEIGPGLIIARNPGGGGIYNAAVESGYDQTSRISPEGTLWNYEGNGFGNLDTIKNRYYTTFSEALKHQVGRNIIGSDLVMHDTINDKYYKFEFSHWGIQGAGTFAYTRTEIIPVSVGVEFPDGTYQPTAWTGFLDRYNKIHVGPFSGHELASHETGSVIYFFNTHVTLPNNIENDCIIGSFYTLVVGNEAASLRVKKYSNANLIPSIESVITPITNVGPFNDTEYPLEPYSIAHLIKIERNKWSLVPAGYQTSIVGEVAATTLSANSVTSDLIPEDDATYDLGSPTKQWKSLYVSANTIFIGGTPLSVDNEGNLTVSGSPVAGGGTADTGNITFDGTTISTADDEQEIRLQTRDEGGNWNTRIRMDPEDVFIRMEVRNGDKVSRIDLDQVDNERITIEGRDIDMVVDVDEDISIHSGDDIDITADDRMRMTGERVIIRSNGSESSINIITDNNDTQQTWQFKPDGGLTFPDSSVQTTAFTSTLSGIDSMGFDTSAGVSVTAGQLAWNSSDGTLDLGTGYADVVLQIGQEILYVVRNDTGSVMSKGTAVYCSGVTSSARIQASPFTADNTVDSTFFLGLATHNFNSGLNGTVTHFGYVRGLDTRGTAASAIAVGDENWSVGDKLYAHPTVAGKLTNVEPTLPDQKICVASVINRHQNFGVLFVRPSQQIPTDLSELTSVGSVSGVLKIDQGVHEQIQTKADATGTVEHDCSSGHIFYHTSPDANWTVNLTNLDLASTYATSVTLIIVQGGTGYYPSVLEIGGVSQTILWQGNATPTPSTNRTDVVTFSIINNGGTYTVLGQLTGF